MQALWRSVARVQRLDSLYLLSGQPLLIPYYHTVSDDELPHIRPLYPHKGVIQFEQDLEALLAEFMPITLSELLRHLRLGDRLPPRPMLLTFDDGLKECATMITPMLKRKGVPASFFLNPAFLDNTRLMYRHQAGLLIARLVHRPELRETAQKCLQEMGWGAMPPEVAIREMRYEQQPQLAQLAAALEVDFAGFLQERQPYMTWQQVQEMREQGFDFGAHSMDHPPLQALPLEERLSQIRESLDIVQAQLALPYRAFAFPFSDRGLTRSFMRQLVWGMEPIADLTFGTSGIRQDVHPRCLQRVDLETPPYPVRLSLKTLFLKYLARKVLRRTRMRRKR
ncbi:MAG: polysaccharide deacetylase family protein [Bacteroidetes bacterium]|nr:polysaccharide deacetylase family protein [Bacteroidota bacterium]